MVRTARTVISHHKPRMSGKQVILVLIALGAIFLGLYLAGLGNGPVP
jgi:hypothetical protein